MAIDRSHAFFKVVEAIGVWSHWPDDSFRAFVLENVWGMLEIHGGKNQNPNGKSPMDMSS